MFFLLNKEFIKALKNEKIQMENLLLLKEQHERLKNRLTDEQQKKESLENALFEDQEIIKDLKNKLLLQEKVISDCFSKHP